MRYLLLRLVGTLVIYAVVPALLIFGLAGRGDLWSVWTYLAIIVILYSVQTLALYGKNPDLLKEQMKPSGRELRGRRSLVIGAQLMSLLVFSIAGLDQRFHWSDVVPPAGVVAGLVFVAMGLGLYTWAMLVNPYFSFAARIQADRGQQVINAGPYAIVRHPGYAGLLMRWVASGLALNSLLSIIPVVIMAALVARAATIEDWMLQNELAGYADYAAKVRYRLIPGIW
jgi:protein-S-isoprenylcysteine O-methyltransferase Ste14